MIIRFTIPGIPQGQGSKTRSRYGHMFEDNAKLRPWRAAALAFAREARPKGIDGPVFAGPVQVTAICYFRRPDHHYGTGRNIGVVKPNAPVWVTTNPDLDKCLRALGDALCESGIVKNDNLIVAWDASKVYGEPRMDVTITEAGEFVTAETVKLYEEDLLA